MRPCLLSILTIITPLMCADTSELVAAGDQPGYDRVLAPFFKSHCNQCHTGEKPKGSFATDPKLLSIDFSDPATRSKWREVVNVLNSHEMPPKKEKQPDPKAVASVIDWITEQAVAAELVKRERTPILRRLNRSEYKNTIADLVGVDFDPSAFPQDPPAAGFDNNGGALTLSPLHLEMYLGAAQQILDRALVEGEQPKMIKWHFEPTINSNDRVRKRLDPKNNPLVNGGQNLQEGAWVVMHHAAGSVHARDFRVPTAGIYTVRVHAATRIPNRAQVVETASKILKKRQEEQDAKQPDRAKWHLQAFENDMKHFEEDRRYDYGPARIKFSQQLGPTPKVMAEFDVPGSIDKPKTHEFNIRFTTESAGIFFDYAYTIPSALENFWMQNRDTFARPELLIDWFEIEGPIYESWPPQTHSRILFDSPNKANNEQEYAREVLARFMRNAYRRPVSPTEIDAKLSLYSSARKEKTFVEAIKLPLIAVMASPNFLFLAEPQSAGASDKATPLTSHQLASRLSYFLWSTMPDDELSKLADSGKIREKLILAQQMDRMLKSPKAGALVRNFAGQWLGLRDVGNNPPASDLYPQYDRHLELSIVAESESFFREILLNDLDARNLIKSDFVVINERLARFYNINGVKGDQFRKVQVPPSAHRGGIVTQASILTTTSNGTRTSPVKRGTWVLKNLMGIDPGLPVANAGEIAPKVPGIDKATVRKRLEIHRQLDQCARCHNKIDPLGFALENFDAAGEWRDQEGFGYKGRVGKNDPVIDSSSIMPDGTEIAGVAGLQQAILAKEDLFLGCLASKLMTYAYGRELGLSDQPAVKAAIVAMKQNKYTLKSLANFIVASDAFATK
ncbi:MAG: DUF1592 domain-containing protein [Planctomycetota bacterium]